jgi:hypothetical protein
VCARAIDQTAIARGASAAFVGAKDDRRGNIYADIYVERERERERETERERERERSLPETA